MIPRRLAVTLLACVTSAARVAVAQDDVEAFGVDYRAPSACPGPDAFFREVRGRTARARAARSGETARVLVVRIEARGERFAGSLSIDDAGARSTPREVEGATCAEVVGALGLVAALAVDPHASVAPRPVPSTAPPDEAPVSAPPEKRAPETPPRATPPPAPSAPAPSRPPPPERTANGTPRFAVGLQAEVSAVAGAVGSGRLFGELVVGRGTFSPSIRIAIARSLEVDRPARIGVAKMRWTTGGVDLCPLRVTLTTGVDALPCVGLAAGVLDAEGGAVGAPQSRSRPWVAGDAHARLVWAPLRAFAVEIEGGAIAPFFRESFFFEPDIPVYEAPPIAAFGRIGASVRFP